MGLSAASVELVRNSTVVSMGVVKYFVELLRTSAVASMAVVEASTDVIYYFRESSEYFPRCFHIFQGSFHGIERKHTVVPETAFVPNMRVVFITCTEVSTTSMGACLLPRKLSLLSRKLAPLPWKLVESFVSIYVLFRGLERMVRCPGSGCLVSPRRLLRRPYYVFDMKWEHDSYNGRDAPCNFPRTLTTILACLCDVLSRQSGVCGVGQHGSV